MWTLGVKINHILALGLLGLSKHVLMPNLDSERKLAQRELKSECGCPHNCYNQFPEDEIYSIQFQMAGHQTFGKL